MKVKISTNEKFHAITVLEPNFTANMTAALHDLCEPFLNQEVKNLLLNLKDIQKMDSAAADGFLDCADLRNIPGLDGDQRGFGHVQIRELVDGRGRAIVIHLQVVEDGHRGAARADARHFVLEIGQHFVHARLGVALHVPDVPKVVIGGCLRFWFHIFGSVRVQ